MWDMTESADAKPDDADAPKGPPSPDEVARKLEDFIKNTLGGQVLFTRMDGGLGGAAKVRTEEEQVEVPGALEDEERPFEFHLRPRDIKAHLDRFVIRQDEAKKVLATAVCDHYNHARMMQEEERQGRAVEFTKQNVVIAGPTGVGKTYLVKHIAEFRGNGQVDCMPFCLWSAMC